MSASRSRDAWRLADALSVAAQVAVEVRWDGSGRWNVQWSGGPTVDAMRPHVEALVPVVAPSFTGVALGWFRGIPPMAWARALIAMHRACESVPLWELEERLRASEYPENGPAEDAELAERLVRLAGPAASEYRMADLLAEHGLSALGVGEAPAGVVSIDEARRRQGGARGN